MDCPKDFDYCRKMNYCEFLEEDGRCDKLNNVKGNMEREGKWKLKTR